VVGLREYLPVRAQPDLKLVLTNFDRRVDSAHLRPPLRRDRSRYPALQLNPSSPVWAAAPSTVRALLRAYWRAAHLAPARPLSAQERSSFRASLLFYLQRRELIYKEVEREVKYLSHSPEVLTPRHVKRNLGYPQPFRGPLTSARSHENASNNARTKVVISMQTCLASPLMLATGSTNVCKERVDIKLYLTFCDAKCIHLRP
jgi:hypothetical protein